MNYNNNVRIIHYIKSYKQVKNLRNHLADMLNSKSAKDCFIIGKEEYPGVKKKHKFYTLDFVPKAFKKLFPNEQNPTVIFYTGYASGYFKGLKDAKK